MRSDLTFKFRKLISQLFMRGQHYAQLDERAHHKDAHLNGLFAVEYIRRHDRAVLSEGIGKIAWVPMLLRTGHKL